MSFLKDAITKKPPEAAPAASSMNLPDRYQGMLDAIPYRNQKYNESPWQRPFSNLGFRTQADAWKENMAVQAAEYDAAIAQKAADEAYETPGAQVARMRAAGLNPDLNGGEGISPGEAQPLPQDPSTPMQSTGGRRCSLFAMVLCRSFPLLSALSKPFKVSKAVTFRILSLRFKPRRCGRYAKDMLPICFLHPRNLPGCSKAMTWKAETLRNARAFSRKLPRKMRFLLLISSVSGNSAPAVKLLLRCSSIV